MKIVLGVAAIVGLLYMFPTQTVSAAHSLVDRTVSAVKAATAKGK
jgi:hypothetical protein